MKIFNNKASGSGSGGGTELGSNVGDVFFSYNLSFTPDPRTVDITYSAFSGDPADYPDLKLGIQNPPTLAGLPITKEYDSSIMPYPVNVHEFGEDIWLTGRNIYNGNGQQVKLVKIKKGEYNTPVSYFIDIGYDNVYSRIITDGVYFYIFKTISSSSVYSFITSFIKFKIEDGTYETINFKSKRIAKAYFEKELNQFVVYEVNATDDNDSDMTKNGIYYYDTFEQLKTVADVSLNRYLWAENQIYGLATKFNLNTLRKKDGRIIYTDFTNKQLKDHSDNSLFVDVVGEDGTNTNVSGFTGIFELFGKVFCSFTDVKDSVSYLACVCKEEGKDPIYAYPYTLAQYSSFLIYDNIFDYDFSKPEPFAPAIIYKDTTNTRKALTFNAVKDNQYKFENINSLNPPSGTLGEFSNYMIQDYYNISNKALDDAGYRVYDNLGFIGHITQKVIDLKFNGYSVPFIYVPAYQQGNLTTYLIVKK